MVRLYSTSLSLVNMIFCSILVKLEKTDYFPYFFVLLSNFINDVFVIDKLEKT